MHREGRRDGALREAKIDQRQGGKRRQSGRAGIDRGGHVRQPGASEKADRARSRDGERGDDRQPDERSGIVRLVPERQRRPVRADLRRPDHDDPAEREARDGEPCGRGRRQEARGRRDRDRGEGSHDPARVELVPGENGEDRDGNDARDRKDACREDVGSSCRSGPSAIGKDREDDGRERGLQDGVDERRGARRGRCGRDGEHQRPRGRTGSGRHRERPPALDPGEGVGPARDDGQVERQRPRAA